MHSWIRHQPRIAKCFIILLSLMTLTPHQGNRSYLQTY